MFKFNPVPEATEVTVLEEARRLLAGDVDGVCWTKHTAITARPVDGPEGSIGVCAVGALDAAAFGWISKENHWKEITFDYLHVTPERSDVRRGAERLVQDTIRSVRPYGSTHVPEVNDKAATTLEQMLRYFDVAIAIAKAREATSAEIEAQDNPNLYVKAAF